MLITLTQEQMQQIDDELTAYDEQYIKSHQAIQHQGVIMLGKTDEAGRIIGGICGIMTNFNIMYVTTLFVTEAYRGLGIGRQLIEALENEAKKLGAVYIRLDTFHFQGRAFYQAVGYEEIGNYTSNDASFSEHFFLKRMGE